MRNKRITVVILAIGLAALNPMQSTGQQPRSAEPMDSKTDQSKPNQTDQPKPNKPLQDRPDVESARPHDVMTLVIDVQSLPPEFAADLLLTIADSKRVGEIDWKKELLDEAFRLAADAQYALPKKQVGPYPVDTQHGYLGHAFRQKLDTLSLRCRAIESMLRHDKSKARSLFADIGKLKLDPLTCSDGMVYVVSDYYKVAGKLAQEAFDKEEMARNEHIRFLEALVSGMTSIVEVPSVINLVRTVKISRSERNSLVSALVPVLAKISGDDRSFSSSMFILGEEMGRLVFLCDQEGIPSAELIRALRTCYVRHFSANRCSDTLRNVGDKGPLPSPVIKFNEMARKLVDKNIPELEADEVKPSRIDGKVDNRFYWQTPVAKELMAKYKQLRLEPGYKPPAPPKPDTESVQWQLDLDKFQKRLSEWKQDENESFQDYFHQKCLMYEGVLELPPWPGRTEAAMPFIAFLNEFDLKNGSRIEWFWHANSLVQRLRRSPGPGSARLLGQLESSTNLVLHVYARTERVLSTPTQKPEN